MTVNFYPRPRTKRDEISIQGVIRWNKQKLAFTVLESVTVKNWNSDSQEVRKSDPQAFVKNARLTDFKSKVEKFNNDFVTLNGIEPTKNQLRELIKPTPQEKTSEAPEHLFDFIDFVIEGHTKRLLSEGKSPKQSVVSSYKQTKQLLREFRPRMDFDDVSLGWYFQFVDYCLDVKQYTPNNTGKHVKNVKAIMNEALSEGVTTNTAHKSKKFKVTKDEVENIYLNREELARLEELDLAHVTHLEKARDLFLVGCWTGLRISDFKRIEKRHLKDERFIAIQTKKTGKEVEIPLHHTVKAILEKYDFKLPQMADQTLNYRIKEVGLMAGIDNSMDVFKVKGRNETVERVQKCDLISSHTARRSFVTNLYLMGVAATTLREITGHRTEESFLTYIKLTNREHSEIIAAKFYEVEKKSFLKVVG